MTRPATTTAQGALAALPMHRIGPFERLAARAPVAIHRSACLRLRTHLAQCHACAQACPTQAIQAGPQSLVLTGDCTGCGRCQAACPTGALRVDGFEAADRPAPVTSGVARLDCHRAPASDRAAARVPCLGGLSAARLLALCANTPVAVVLVERGLCAACQSGGREHPARATLQRVVALMAEAGVPASMRPRIEPLVCGAGVDVRSSVDPMQHRGRARRGFLSALARPSSAGPREQPSRPMSVPSAERQLAIAALQVLVERHGGRMPASLVHRLEVGATCRGHRVCASACPTGALLRWRDDGAARMGIAFDSVDCIGCGHCASACPEQALQLRLGGGDAPAGRRHLTVFMQRECVECGARFALKADEGQTRCERCRKSGELARSAFQTLFGSRPRTPGTGVYFNEELR